MDGGHANPRRRLWAVFSNDEEGYSYQITTWKPKEEAENALTALLEGGEANISLVPKD